MKVIGMLFLLLSALGLVAQEDLVVHDFASLGPYLEQENDTVYVVNFWATWCKPCVEELPYFESLTEEYSDLPVKVLLVSLDFKTQIESKLKPFIAEQKLTSEVVVFYERNPNDWIDKVDPAWSGAIPATLIWRKQDKQLIEGQFASYNELKEIINSLLNT